MVPEHKGRARKKQEQNSGRLRPARKPAANKMPSRRVAEWPLTAMFSPRAENRRLEAQDRAREAMENSGVWRLRFQFR